MKLDRIIDEKIIELGENSLLRKHSAALFDNDNPKRSIKDLLMARIRIRHMIEDLKNGLPLEEQTPEFLDNIKKIQNELDAGLEGLKGEDIEDIKEEASQFLDALNDRRKLKQQLEEIGAKKQFLNDGSEFLFVLWDFIDGTDASVVTPNRGNHDVLDLVYLERVPDQALYKEIDET
jgi:hypothetical protein